MTDLATFLPDAIEGWMAREAVSGRRFGEVAIGDPGLVAQLRRGRSLRLRTADRLLAFMGMAPVEKAFRREVEAFLAATGLKVSLFGELAAGDAKQLDAVDAGKPFAQLQAAGMQTAVTRSCPVEGSARQEDCIGGRTWIPTIP